MGTRECRGLEPYSGLASHPGGVDTVYNKSLDKYRNLDKLLLDGPLGLM